MKFYIGYWKYFISLWKLHLNSDREDIHRLYKYWHQTTGNLIPNSSNATALLWETNLPTTTKELKWVTPRMRRRINTFYRLGKIFTQHFLYKATLQVLKTLLKKIMLTVFLMIFPYSAETVQLFSRMTRMTHAILI